MAAVYASQRAVELDEIVPPEVQDYTTSMSQVKKFANQLLSGYQADSYMREMQKETLLRRKMRELATEKKRQQEAANVSKSEGIKEIELIDWLQKEMDDEQACLTLPCSIGLVVVFSFLVLWHFSIPHQMDVSQSMTNWVTENANFAIDTTNTWGIKGLEDVHNLGDFYSFIRLGFIPLMLQSGYVYSELGPSTEYYATLAPVSPGTMPEIKSSDLMRFNHIAADVRITIRSSTARATCDTQYVPANFQTAFSSDNVTDTTAVCYENPNAYEIHDHFRTKDVNELAPVGSFDYEGSVQYRYLKLTDSAATLERQVRQMEEDGVIKENTYKIEIDFINFNRAYGLVSLVTTHFVFYRGGQILKKMTVTSQWVTDFGRFCNFDQGFSFILLVDLFWIAMNAYILLSELKDIRKDLIYWGSYRQFIFNYFGIWNLVDWSIMISSIFVTWRFLTLNKGLDDLGELVKNGGFVSGVEEREALYGKVEDNMSLVAGAQLQAVLYIVVSMCRMFKGFSAQPRLGLVTNTIWKAASDILHFLIVFGSVFATFAVIGTLLFGTYVPEYSSISRGLISCWRMVAGDFDYAQLKEVSWTGTAVYFMFFHLLIVLIMLNMLLAIILETYLEVKHDETAKAETLYSQAMESFGRYVRSMRRERMNLDEILDRLLGAANRRILVRRELESRHALAYASAKRGFGGGGADGGAGPGNMPNAEVSKQNTLAAIHGTSEVFPYTFLWRMIVRGPFQLWINERNNCSLEDEDFFIPGHKTLAFIKSEGRFLTPKKLKQMIPDIPSSQAERVTRSALVDSDNTVEITIPSEIATEALYTMLSDDHAEMVDKIGLLEKKINSLLSSDSFEPAVASVPVTRPLATTLRPPRGGEGETAPDQPFISTGDDQISPYSYHGSPQPQQRPFLGQQQGTIVQTGPPGSMKNQLGEMSQRLEMQQQQLELQNIQLRELTELLAKTVNYLVPPTEGSAAAARGSSPGGSNAGGARGVNVRRSGAGAGRCGDMIFCGNGSRGRSGINVDDEEINVQIHTALQQVAGRNDPGNKGGSGGTGGKQV
eukprot:CAMPEP_0179009944 /NCGR_PEP_ID=MMETSP0795-20121207/16540_1 /TAXON_ID=88552 /ORGANISM="Amoebophrya sp., Strain Ameob2" /LENGTH=1054 /DNA_ID=CAMNT_0020705171 /DNA_START=173 /DNA_END=3337 /DNA_ORIENTATION=-